MIVTISDKDCKSYIVQVVPAVQARGQEQAAALPGDEHARRHHQDLHGQLLQGWTGKILARG